VTRSPLPALVVAVAISIAGAAPVCADELNPDLEQARRQKRALRYDEARASLDRALARGGNSPAQLAEIYRLRGEVAAGLGDRRAAEESFRRLLALVPTASLPAGVSPKIADPFAAARASLAGRPPLSVTHQIERGASPALVVVVESDPIGMVAGARVQYLRPGGRWITSEVRGRGRLRLALPAEQLLSLAIAIIDDTGNVLVGFGSRDRPLEVATAAPGASPRPPDDDRQRSPSLIARWQLWAAVAVSFGAAGSYFAIDTARAENDLDAIYDRAGTTEFADVMDRIDDLESRGERSALLANIGFGIAGASALTAAILLIRDASGRERTAGVSLAPSAGGLTVGWRQQF
jgi:hypothetical protein